MKPPADVPMTTRKAGEFLIERILLKVDLKPQTTVFKQSLPALFGILLTLSAVDIKVVRRTKQFLTSLLNPLVIIASIITPIEVVMLVVWDQKRGPIQT